MNTQEGDNICCPHLIVLDCGDAENHKHIGCRGSIDGGVGLDNETAKHRCLDDFEHCPMRPRGENC